jgi:MFS family permease
MKLASRFALFDYVGAILQAGLLTSGIMAINFGGTLYSWGSGQTIGMFVAAGVLLIGFAVQQTFCIFTSVDGRMFPVHFLKMKEPILLFILMAANNAGAFILMYYIPLYFQFTRGSGALHSGVQMLPLIIAVTVAIMLNGAMMSKFGYYFPWYVCGSALLLIGGGLLCKFFAHDFLPLTICACTISTNCFRRELTNKFATQPESMSTQSQQKFMAIKYSSDSALALSCRLDTPLFRVF